MTPSTTADRSGGAGDALGQAGAIARLRRPLVLRDGTTVLMRAIRRDDRSRLHAFHSRLSFETIYWRYFAVLPALPEKLVERLTQVDYENRLVLVATKQFGEEEAIIAVVQYDRSAATSGEIGCLVEDGWQGLGIGTALLQHLAEYARSCGIETLTAVTMASNQRMLSLLRHSGFPLVWSNTGGELDAELDITQLPTAAKPMQAALSC